MTKIEWTDETWNPVVGCTKVSEGCKNCYAIQMAWRLQSMGHEKYLGTVKRAGRGYNWTGNLNIDLKSLWKPYDWKKPLKIFVNSMSDLFHEQMDFGMVKTILRVIRYNKHHTFQILTKHPDRAWQFYIDGWPELMIQKSFQYRNDSPGMGENIWLGVSVENQEMADKRIPHLSKIPTPVRFLSCEPLLGPVDLRNYLQDIDWVIVGGESGPGARPIKTEWVEDIKDQCLDAGVPFFFKQWGSFRKGNFLNGRQHLEFPVPRTISNVNWECEI